jgi:HK97 family phage major capsid protein
MGPVNDEAAPRIWGLPVTLNENMPAEATGLEPIFVAAREAAQVLRRNTLTLAVTDSHADEFTSNVLRFRAELRTSFPIYRPAGISVVTSLV